MRQMELSLASDVSASAVVPMQKDYIHDPKLCLAAVSWLPKRISVAIQTKLIAQLSAIEPDFYYYSGESLHITVQSIRTINDPPHFGPPEIAKSQNLLSACINTRTDPFEFELRGLLSMPTSVSVIALVTPDYDRIVRSLRVQLVAAGIHDDKKYFTNETVFANVTICRYTHAPSRKFLDAVLAYKDMHIGRFVAESVSLIETNAAAHPSKTRVFGTYKFRQI